MARRDCRARQLVSGVGHQRRAGLGGVGDRAALGEQTQQLRPHLLAVVVVVGDHRAPAHSDPVNVHQVSQRAGVLGRKHVGLRQDVEGAQGYVTRGPDRRRHEIKPGSQRWPVRVRPVVAVHLSRLRWKVYFAAPTA